MNNLELIWQFLKQYFFNEYYKVAIDNIIKDNKIDPLCKKKWNTIVEIIKKKAFSKGEPLLLVCNGANQVLDENSDQEAYYWLEKMIDNVENRSPIIDEY